MSVTLQSTTDSEQAVTAALGNLAQSAEKAEEKESAPGEEPSEKEADESEASEGKEAEGEDAKDDDEESEEKEEQEKPKKRNGFKKRIDKLNRRLSEREQEIEYWKSQALKQGPADTKKEEPKASAKADSRPVAEAFETYEEYILALNDWRDEQRQAEREAKAKEAQVKTEYQKAIDTYAKRAEAFKEAHEDFDEVLSDVDHVPMSVTVQQALLEAENGPELAYELAKNPEEFERICSMNPTSALMALGRFAAKLARDSSEQKEVKKTKAPPPLKPVGSKASASTKSPDEMDYQEFKRWREAQLK